MEQEAGSAIQGRLQAVKKAIAKASTEASKNPTFVADGRILENREPNASFHLGMELFGQEATVIERNVQAKLGEVETELDDVMDAMQRAGVQDDMQEDNKESMTPKALQAEGSHLRLKIAFLRDCSKVRALLDESIALSTGEQSELEQSAKKLMEAQQLLDTAQKRIPDLLPGSDSSVAASEEFRIVDAIRRAVRSQKVDLIRRAKTLWYGCVELTPNSLSVRAGSKMGKNGLEMAYGTLEALSDPTSTNSSSVLEDILRKFVKDLQQEVFASVLESGRKGTQGVTFSFQESEQRSSTSGSTVVTTTHSQTLGPTRKLEWSIENNESLSGESETLQDASPFHATATWADTISFIQRILSFVVEHVLRDLESPCRFVGMRLFGKRGGQPQLLNLDALNIESRRLGDDNGLLMEPLMESLISSCIPSSLKPNELDGLSSAASQLRLAIGSFLDFLESSGLLEQSADSRLAEFIDSFEKHYVDKRRCAILNKARALLTKTDYHNTVQVGVEVPSATSSGHSDPVEEGLAVFKLHKCSISNTAFAVMNLCRKTMDEAVEQPVLPEESALRVLPASLYRSARESLDLFRALVPVSYGYEIKNVPRTAAVFHNDCVFLAHHCLTLGLEYRDKFRSSHPDDAQKDLLAKACIFVDMVPLFRDLADKSLGEMLDLQASQLVEVVGPRIQLLGDALRSDEVLAEWGEAETAVNAAAYHLRHLFQVWEPVLSRAVLKRCLRYLSDVVLDLFLDQVLKAKDISASACRFAGELFQQMAREVSALVGTDSSGSRVWNRFSAVGRFMDMSLADIEVALSDGIFSSATAAELKSLIIATFDDSPKRKSVLSVLATA